MDGRRSTAAARSAYFCGCGGAGLAAARPGPRPASRRVGTSRAGIDCLPERGSSLPGVPTRRVRRRPAGGHGIGISLPPCVRRHVATRVVLQLAAGGWAGLAEWLAATASNGRPTRPLCRGVVVRARARGARASNHGGIGGRPGCLTGTVVARRELAGPAVQPSLRACYCCARKICYQLGGTFGNERK
ncbi:hypothetical protein C2845_PM07G14750 [Panicum miliaceum]|uniref:Uncharacterized protein n=1 Tax=Panicum miliaceum TaxID=4540 RepID=A0A3L6SJE7_PANMI|nr:hypothetical protein C2845_PM07G14750 [Panicum miliaceum]